MKILVCLKVVPDTNARLSPSDDGKWIDEEGVAFVSNEFDLFALEAALKLKDADADTEVVVVSIGPGSRCKQSVRTALAMGADRALILGDDAFHDGDPWSNSTTLAGVARSEGPFDAVFTGLQSADMNFGQTGPLLAERLGWPCATGAMSIALKGDSFVVERELDGDRREVVSLPLPAVVTVQTGAGDTPPRYANIKGIMAAKKKEVKTPVPADLGLDTADVGRAGARMDITSLAEPTKSAGAEIVDGSPTEIAAELVRRIREHTGVI